MRTVACLALLASLALGSFAWWGTSTAAGRARFDEMDGIYPLGAGLLAALLIMLAFILGLIVIRRVNRTR